MAFVGGSAWAMARDISEGFVTLSAPAIRKWEAGDFALLQQELEKLAREARGVQVDLDDTTAIQSKNRRLQRISSALALLQAQRLRRFR